MKKVYYSSIDEADKASVEPLKSPYEYEFTQIELSDQPGGALKQGNDVRLSLNGKWQMAESGYEFERKDPCFVWEDGQEYIVPGSIHTSLLKNGKIPDPLIGLNDKQARENSYKVWWCKREFDYDRSFKNPKLVFEGVCYSAMFYLNGHCLGSHRGMFTKAVFDVGKFIKRHNVLVVRIDDAPALPRAFSQDADFDDGWKFGTVINCVYGWHYACIASRGIWKPVYIEETPEIICEKPFIFTVDAEKGEMGLSMITEPNLTGTLSLCISSKNFSGETMFFSGEFQSGTEGRIHYRFTIPKPRLWWPNQCGEQNLYEAKIVFAPNHIVARAFCETFGIRTVRMVSGGAKPSGKAYCWQLQVNGRDVFIKGANWCTTDVLLRFEKNTYERMLTLAKAQNLNLLRAWGCGMPESETFYELCDELGLMVFQEWPTAWDSDKTQPYDEMHETVEQNMIRIRNHPSLVLYAGGNESGDARSPVMDDMIRLSYNLDGTRPFRRTLPYGEGSLHSYTTYWYMNGIDASLQLEAVFLSEFGMASAPNVDSVLRYTPEEERELWDLHGEHNTFLHHTPRFNQIVDWPYGLRDVDHLTKYVGNFYDEENLEHFVTGTQLAQAVIYKHPIEKFRCNYPRSTGISYYKLNDVYPACSWSTIDYYGAPKMSYYFVKHAFEPLHACVVTPSVDVKKGTVLPIYLLNDNLERADCVRVRVLDGNFRELHRESIHVGEVRRKVCKIGEVHFSEADCNPIFVVLQTVENGIVRSTNFDFFNYKDDSGCLFRLKETRLEYSVFDEHTVSVRNAGDVPAVCVMLDRFGENDTFFSDDNALWLDAGEEIPLKVNCTQGLRLRAWNSKWES